MKQEIILKSGPKSEEEKQIIIKEIINQIITGEIHEKTTTENAKKLNISRYTYRKYLPLAYSQVEINPELEIKKVKDIREYLVCKLLEDFSNNEDFIQRNILIKNINSLLESQEKSSFLIMQQKNDNKDKNIEIAQPRLFTDILSKI